MDPLMVLSRNLTLTVTLTFMGILILTHRLTELLTYVLIVTLSRLLVGLIVTSVDYRNRAISLCGTLVVTLS